MVISTARNLGPYPFLVVELWGVLLGLDQAWERGYRRLILEIDSQEIVHMLSGASSGNTTNNYLIEGCKDILSRDWAIELSHIYREANSVANESTYWALFQPIGHHLLYFPFLRSGTIY